MRKSLFVLAVLWLSGFVFFNNAAAQTTQGELDALGKNGNPLGACPLKHTDVKTEISGFIARVRVRQEFENNFTEKIEAVYTFPLSNRAAVDDMTMKIGERTTVRGKILKREEARAVYETARNNGQVASLLDQERPNIFTQSVANILPGERVTIEISYVETLKYDSGVYEFVFPTVVAPRYNPATVADAAKISPPVAATRTGHDISIEVNLDAGVPIENIVSNSHQIESAMFSATSAKVKLKDEKVIPNKDFILRYDVSGKRINDAILTHRTERGGYFSLILQPPDEPRTEDITPKEIVFVLDTSGSMEGFPIEKAKESMKLALDGMNPNDTFNLITFAGDTHILFPQPVAATRDNLKKAQAFLKERKGSGGTEMMTAIKAALAPSDSPTAIRVVCFMTDGAVGNEAEIIAEVQKHKNARVFSFGIGSSVNRSLLDKIAEEGRGEAEYVSLNDDGSAAAKRFYERVRSPLLTDVSVDWNNLPVADVYPKRIGDLFSAKPVVIHGRFTGAANGTIRLKGKTAGRETIREININFPETEAAHDTLATLWARSRVDDLTAQDYNNAKPEIKEAIINLALEYRLLTQFTSFVAVEEIVVTDKGQPRRIDVPVELPEGMSRAGVSGGDREEFIENFWLRRQSPTSNDPHGFIFTVSSGRRSKRKAQVPNKILVINGVTLSQNGQTVDTVQIDGASGGENSFVIDGQDVTNFRNGTVNGNNDAGSGNLIGKALNLPKPNYPVQVDASVSGVVNVQVVIDENGNVVEATAVSGHPLLRAMATQAAKMSKVAPTQIGGKPVKLAGVISYDFNKSKKTEDTVVLLQNFAVKLTPEQQKLRELQAKTAPAIFALLVRLQIPDAVSTPDEAKFVADGKAEVRVWFADKTPSAIAELQKYGFELVLDPTTAKFVIGRIALDKLAALAESKSVTFVAPQNK